MRSFQLATASFKLLERYDVSFSAEFICSDPNVIFIAKFPSSKDSIVAVLS